MAQRAWWSRCTPSPWASALRLPDATSIAWGLPASSGCAPCSTLLIAVVVLLATADAGIVPIALAAALAGLTLPPLSSTVRIVWPRLAPGELRSTAYALEAALQEVFFVGGPLLAAALSAIEPAAAVAGAGLASLVGATFTARLPPVRATPGARATGAGLLGALGSPGVRTVVLYAATVGVGFGAVELAMPAFAEEHGAGLGGVALACFSGGASWAGSSRGCGPRGATCAGSSAEASRSRRRSSRSSWRSRSPRCASSRSWRASRSHRRSARSTR